MDYTINAVDEAAQHIVVTWTDAAGTLHDHERVAGLFNTAVLVPNPDHNPLDPEQSHTHITELHSTPDSIRAELEAFMERFNAGLTAEPAPAQPVRLVRASLTELAG